MPRYTYTGDQRLMYSFYLDVTGPEHVTTLVAEPGGTYDIKQADSPRVIQPDGQFTDQELAMPPDENWTAAEAPKAAAKKKESGADA